MALSDHLDPVNALSVLSGGSIEVREALFVFRDGVEISKSYHRYVLHPGDDLTGKDSRIGKVAQAVWTPEVIAAHKAVQEAALNDLRLPEPVSAGGRNRASINPTTTPTPINPLEKGR